MIHAPRMIATCIGIGNLPAAPGTWASVAAIPLAWALHIAGGFWAVGLGTIVLGILGYWATARYLDDRVEDAPEVVIDEVVGMMIALWPLSLGLILMGAERYQWPWPGWVLGFLMFRFFDIVKPVPVSWADRIPGPTGVMLGDIVAGTLTASIVMLAAGVAHGLF